MSEETTGPVDTLSGGWGDARLPELTARFGHPLNDDCEYASGCVVGALMNAEKEITDRSERIERLRAALTETARNLESAYETLTITRVEMLAAILDAGRRANDALKEDDSHA